MIATVFFALVFGAFTVWVTWQWGIGVAVLTWVSLAWGMLINFSAGVERGQAERHRKNVERMEDIKREAEGREQFRKGTERVH